MTEADNVLRISREVRQQRTKCCMIQCLQNQPSSDSISIISIIICIILCITKELTTIQSKFLVLHLLVLQNSLQSNFLYQTQMKLQCKRKFYNQHLTFGFLYQG